MLWRLFSVLLPISVLLGIVYVIKISNFWKYITTSKQKSWEPDFLLEGEELRVVRPPYSFPENHVMIIDYGYNHDVATSDKDVVIYWKRSDYFEAKRLYESQIK